MKILAIRLARFGDIVLLLPAVAALKKRFPESRITFVTDQRWAPLAMMCPAIDEVVGIDRLGMRDGSLRRALADIGRIGKEIRRHQFDAVIDFHGFRETSLMAWWSRAPQRMGLRRFDQSYWGWCFNLPPVVEDKQLHVSKMFLRVANGFLPDLALSVDQTEALVIPESAREWVKQSLPSSPYVALYVDAPVKERIWPRERFEQLARYIVNRLGVPVVVLSGADRNWENSDNVQAFSGLSIPQLAAAIGSARLLVSNDTGPMHLGPALGVPTLAIFSVGFPQHFGPTGKHDVVVQGSPIESVGTEVVTAAVDRLWAATSGR